MTVYSQKHMHCCQHMFSPPVVKKNRLWHVALSLSLSDHSKSGTDGSTTPSKNPRTNPQMQITAPSTILGLSPLSVYSSSSYWSRFSSVWDFGLVSYGSTALFPRLVWTCEAADCSHEWSMTSSGSGRPSSVEHSPFGLSSLAPEGTESSNPVRLRLAKLHCMHCIGATSCLHREGDLRLHVNGAPSSGTLNSSRAFGFTLLDADPLQPQVFARRNLRLLGAG